MATKPEVTREEIEKFLAYEQERLEADRKSANLKRLAEPLKKKMEQYVQSAGGTDRTCTHYGFVLALQLKRGQPSWKDEFLKVAGQEAAAEISENVPMKEYLVVTPAS